MEEDNDGLYTRHDIWVDGHICHAGSHKEVSMKGSLIPLNASNSKPMTWTHIPGIRGPPL